MTMQSAFLKEQEGTMPSPNCHISASIHWWSGLGSPSNGGDLGAAKRSLPQFTIFPGNLKASGNVEKSVKQSASPEYQGHLGSGYGQSLICGKYGHADPSYGLFSPYGSQLTGRIMLPLDLTSDEGPVYVNAKQYHGIIRRRISRAKAVAVNKVLKNRKPYLHLSRHLHAVRRPRGCGGRFLNTKTSSSKDKTGNETGKETGFGKFSLSIDSQNSEVLESDSGNLSSPSEENIKKSNTILGTEVTSIFSSANLDFYSSNHLKSFAHPLSEMMNTGHGLAMSSNWI